MQFIKDKNSKKLGHNMIKLLSSRLLKLSQNVKKVLSDLQVCATICKLPDIFGQVLNNFIL